ncbi:MAG: translesion error-prone DNA polymerase V autoproteolytic subunit [Gammaproteobacteria bacterium]|nr:translesion error-prone DNA polymerase V autoproteolytic subunit [Gammaproteobacteria bacterium]
MNHGGKRKGAGRPKGQGKYKEATKPIRLPVSMLKSVLKYIQNKSFKIPLYGSKISAGFPTLADDHIEEHLDLNEHLIKNPASTFFVRATGNSMLNAGIHENDILIIDRSIIPTHGKIVIAAIDGQLTVKKLHIKNKELLLMPENPEYSPIKITEENDTHIWGVVTNIIHSPK